MLVFRAYVRTGAYWCVPKGTRKYAYVRTRRVRNNVQQISYRFPTAFLLLIMKAFSRCRAAPRAPCASLRYAAHAYLCAIAGKKNPLRLSLVTRPCVLIFRCLWYVRPERKGVVLIPIELITHARHR